jgi:hypothetical protein
MMINAFEHVAVTAFRKAIDKSPAVVKIFKHKLTPPSTSVQRYSQLASDFVMGKLIAKLDYQYTLRHGITEEVFNKCEDRWEIVTEAIVRYANSTIEPRDIADFMYSSPFRSDFLLHATKAVTVAEIGKLPKLSDISHLYIRKFQDTGGFRIDLSAIVDWYNGNYSKVKESNRGAFDISPMANLASFLESVIQYCWVHGYQFFPLYSPQWFLFWKEFADIWNVSLDGSEEVIPITNDTNYEHKTIKSPVSMFTI